jgi:hypothetical protein
VLEEEWSGGVVVLHGCVFAYSLRKANSGRGIANMAGARFHSTHLAIRELFTRLSFTPPHAGSSYTLQKLKRSRRGLWRFDGMWSE